MNKQELLDELNRAWAVLRTESSFSNGIKTGVELGIRLVEELEEPEKVVVPKFVADFIEWKRTENLDNWKMASAFISYVKYQKGGGYEWSQQPGNMDIFLSALINGYEVEKEKLYQVIIPTKDKLFKYYYLDGDGGINMVDKLESVESHTEEFIRSVSDDLFQFAVEVAE